MHRRSRIALTLVVAAAAAGGILAAVTSNGGAQSGTAARTIHFVATDAGGYEEKGRFASGSSFGFSDRVRLDGGATGRTLGVCTITNLRRREAFCHVVAFLAGGQLDLAVFNREATNIHPFAVLGGTGAYAGARGSGVARELSESKTDVTVDLLG